MHFAMNLNSNHLLELVLHEEETSYYGFFKEEFWYRYVIIIFSKHGLELRVVKRYDYNLDQINWADAIVTAGGDGTFLNAATKVVGRSKPVIGVNTDPLR